MTCCKNTSEVLHHPSPIAVARAQPPVPTSQQSLQNFVKGTPIEAEPLPPQSQSLSASERTSPSTITSIRPTASTSSSEISTSGLESSIPPSLSRSAPTISTMPALSQHTLAPVPSSQVPSHSSLGAALGGAFGGITAVALAGLLFYFLRRQKRKHHLKRDLKDDEPGELPANNPLVAPNVKRKDDPPKASEPATELDSKPLNSPVAPNEFHEKGSDVNRKPSPPPRSGKRPSPFHQPASPSDGNHMSISPVSAISGSGPMSPLEPSAQRYRPDSLGSSSGPWHDRY